MVFAYFVTVETRHPVDVAGYADVANKLVTAPADTLGDTQRLLTVTKCKELPNAKVEVEVSRSEEAVTASAVVQADLPKFTFDKNVFTSMLKAELPLAVSITKRAVEQL